MKKHLNLKSWHKEAIKSGILLIILLVLIGVLYSIDRLQYGMLR